MCKPEAEWRNRDVREEQILTAAPDSAQRGRRVPYRPQPKRRWMPSPLRNLLVFAVCAMPVILGAASTEAQEPSATRPPVPRSGCGFLNFTTKELVSALKECDAFAPFLQPDTPRSQAAKGPFALGLPRDAAPMLFGQGRFVQRFPLYLNGLYPPHRTDDGAAGPATVKRAALGATVRGGMIEDNSDDIGQPTVRIGSVTWAADPALLSATDKVSRIVGDLAIDGRKIALSLAMSPGEAGNGLTLEIKIGGEDEAELGVPRIRRTGDRSGEPMDMVGRRRSNGASLFIPAADPQSLRNIANALLKGQWIDVPVRLKSETSYTLTMELAGSGQALVKRAFADWNLPGAPQ